MYTHKNCSMIALSSLCNTKVVRQIVLKTSTDISTYIAFNTKCMKSSLSQLEVKTIRNLLLKSSNQEIIADRASKINCQFLPAKRKKKTKTFIILYFDNH